MSANSSPTRCHPPVALSSENWDSAAKKTPFQHDVIKREHSPTQVGYDDELGGDADEDDKHAIAQSFPSPQWIYVILDVARTDFHHL